MNKVLEIIRKVTDAVTILGPAITAVVGIFNAQGVIVVDGVFQIILIVLDAASAICSVIFNIVDSKQKQIAAKS